MPATNTKPVVIQMGKLFTEEAAEQVFDQYEQLQDPDLVLQKASLQRKDLRRIGTDDEVTQLLETRREVVVSTPWRLEAAEEDGNDEAVDQVSLMLTKHMETLVSGAWHAVPYGYSVCEVVYSKLEAGGIGIESVQRKPMQWFRPLKTGELALQVPNQAEVVVDTNFKFLHTVRDGSYENPFGEALLSRAYWPWMYRHHLWRFLMNHLEAYGDPLIVGKVTDPQAFVDAMSALGLKHVIGANIEEDIEVKTYTASDIFVKVEAELVRRFQKLILGQSLTSQVGETGSYAAAKVANEVREDKKHADIRLVSGTIQTLVRALWLLNNFGDDTNVPTFVLSDGTGLENERAERDATLTNAGILKFTEKYIASHYELDDDEFEVPTADGEQDATDDQKKESDDKTKAGAPDGLHLANGTRFTPDQEEIEALVDGALRSAQFPLSPEALKQHILTASSAEDLIDSLLAEYADSDPKEFQNLLQQALFTADVIGYTAAAKE